MEERAAARGWLFAPTLWELIEARAAATPDAVLDQALLGGERQTEVGRRGRIGSGKQVQRHGARRGGGSLKRHTLTTTQYTNG